MVKLVRLTLQGFKSFKNKTPLDIKEGITCIAGANGSGKSNLLDAFLFVLGKNSAKSLRADKMEDLIFRDSKGGANSAKVELEIDNADRGIKLDENIVKIYRKVNITGQSVYKLNGKTDTRQRILDLLREARISPEGINIVTQGDITRILEMSPVERRQIIDDLAGLAEFDEKKKKSQHELNKVEEILREQTLLLKEKEKIFNNISEEKRKVEIYEELDEKIKRLRFSTAKKRLDELTNKKAVISEKIAEFENSLSNIDEEIRKYDEEILKIEQKIRDITKSIFKGEDIKYIEEYEKTKSEILMKENKIDGNIREIERLKNFIEQVNEIEKPRAVKFLIGKKGIIGTIEQLIRYKDKYKEAISSAIGNAGNYLIVENIDKVDYYIKYLKENKIGTAKFLPLDKLVSKFVEKPSGDGVIDIAINLVDYNKKYRKVVEYILGSVLVVDSLENAKKFINKYRIVTLDGTLVEKSGAVYGGYRDKKYDLVKINKNIKELEEENKKLEKEISELEEEIEKINKRKEDIEKKYGSMDDIIGKEEQGLKELREKKRKKYEKKLRLQNDLSNEKIKLARCEVELNGCKEELNEMEVFDEVEEGSIVEMKQLINKYTKEIISLGPLNMKSVEDFEKYKEDYEVLKEKVEKIIEEKYAILRVIQEIDEKRKDVFMELFNHINEEFKNIYHKFTEGEGYLQLEEEDNIYSGLLIKVRSKGKHLLGIDSLSGGEKTMTAIAFLLAVQRCRPTCFCLLDEIDAALDRENSKKIMEVIKEFSKEQQYVIITHNEITIAQSDTVYGVINENGVSSIVGIKITSS
ncbi:MAG: hypothetical protein B6U88_00015 [Candidatus Aenigmarchaeota archaeon ex4484_56]|nr:MAG: hypothetical protein B6U88_00015 [Candidatus Aenigmarchaeota archaeon ex4484_56]